MTISTRPAHPIFPITLPEFVLSSIGTALAIYAIGSMVGVKWFG